MEGKAGVLYVTVKKANLSHDTETLGKMDPFVTLKLGKFQQQTTIKENAGKIAVWEEKFEFTARNGDTLEIRVLDKEDVGADDEVGHAHLNLNTEKLKSKETLVVPIFYGKEDKNKGGEVTLDLEFSEVENRNFFVNLVDNKKQQVESLEGIVRGLRADVEALKKKNVALTQEREAEHARWQEEKALLVKSVEAQKEGNQNHEHELIFQITSLKEELAKVNEDRIQLAKLADENKAKIVDLTKDNQSYRQKLRNAEKEETQKGRFDFTCCGGALATVLIFSTYVIGSRF